jgi:hypothetical protein
MAKKIDNALSCFGLMVLGASYFGLAYGMRADDVVAFKWGLILYTCITPLAIYIFCRYKKQKGKKQEGL